MLVFDTLPGLFIGIAVSLLLLVYRASAPHVAVLGKVPGTRTQYTDFERHADNEPVPGVVIVRPESGLFFANADYVRRRVLAEVERRKPHAIVLDAETVPYVDVTAVNMLTELAETLQRRGVELVFAHDVGEVRDVMRRAGDTAAARVYPTVQAAVDAPTRG